MKAIIIGLFSLIAVVTCSARNDFWLGRDYSVSVSFDGEDLGRTNAPTPAGFQMPNYPGEMMRAGMTGWVKITYVVNEDGSTRDLEVKEATAPEFASSVRSAFAAWRFNPGIELSDLKPAVARMSCTIRFAMDERE